MHAELLRRSFQYIPRKALSNFAHVGLSQVEVIEHDASLKYDGKLPMVAPNRE